MITSYGPGSIHDFGFKAKEVKTNDSKVQNQTVEKKPKKVTKRNKTK